MEALSTSCTAQITGMPQINGISDKIAKYAGEIADIKNLLYLNLKKCFYELKRLNRFVLGIEDSQMRLILTLRYINRLSWQQVALSIGERDEQYPRKRHNVFIRKYKLDEKDELNVLK